MALLTIPMYNLTIMATDYELLDAGDTLCSREWNGHGPYACYMIYYLQAGRSRLQIAGRDHRLQPGRVYFFSGYHLGRYGCDSMRVRWLHLNPTNFTLTRALNQAAPLHSWANDLPNYWRDLLENIDRRILTQSAPPAQLRLHAFIQDILARVIAGVDQPFDPAGDTHQPLAPAIAYMDRHHQQCPSLETVARAAGLAPNYFHHLFRRHAGLSPYRYMLNKRMSLAQHLLLTTDLPIKAVAQQTGYPCPFHFAKTFRRYFGQSPSQRRTHWDQTFPTRPDQPRRGARM